MTIEANKKYGKLTPLRKAYKDKHGRWMWLCRCECGKEKVILGQSITQGNTRSCGCLQSQNAFRVGKLNKKQNTTVDHNGYLEVFTAVGGSFLIDKNDWPSVCNYYWQIDYSNGYVKANNYKGQIYLHRLLLNASENEVVDHINRNRRDNRRSNLRFCDKYENAWNASLGKNNTSGTTGVCYISKKNKWESFLTCRGIEMRKQFKTKEEAVTQRKKWEHEYYGEYAPQLEN